MDNHTETFGSQKYYLSGWDGLYNGKAVDLGVYTYLIKVRFGQREILLKGSVTLLR